MKKTFTILIAAIAAILMVAQPMKVMGQRTTTTLWSENFSSYSADDVPSGGTYSYVCTNGTYTQSGKTKTSYTKIYNEESAGSSSPELLVARTTGGSFSATIPLDNIEGTLTLTYYQNAKKLKVSSSTSGVSGGQELKPSAAGQQTTTFTGITTSMTSITIVFETTTSENVRLDNIVLTGTQVTPTYSITAQSNNTDHGTVSLSGSTITASPSTGYRVSTTNPYTISPSGSATVVQNEQNVNKFTVTPTANTTITINFEAIPTNTVTLPANDQYGTYTMSGATNPVASGTEVTLVYTPGEGYGNYEATWSVNGSPISGNKFTMPDEAVTVTVSVDLIQWVKTSLTDLTPGDVFVIVGTDTEGNNVTHYALPNDGGTSAPLANTTVGIENDALTSKPAAKLLWVLVNASSGYSFYPLNSTTTYLYCNTTASSSSNNNMRIGTGDRKAFSIDDNGYLITNDNFTTRYLNVYYPSGTAQDWRGYVNTGGTYNNDYWKALPVTFYKKVIADVTITTNIAAYSDDTNGWNLIASPVASVTPSDENGFLTYTYDLYRFDQTGGDNGKSWRNYKQNNFNLVSGSGYLYANSADTELTFTGQPYNGNGVVGLTYVADVEDATLKGLNLIGNPYNSTARINKPFYRINEQHNGFTAEVAANSAVNAMEGVFVYASAVNQTVIFTPVAESSNAQTNNVAMVAMNLVQNRGRVIDRAIVCFDSEDVLPKFQLFENSTKLYITKDGKDYAIVGSEAQGEMPVNFKASKDGEYTISINPENVEMSYLHLIDNIAGQDIDLLNTPSYTFEAKGDDYESRFRLVFSASQNGNDNQNEDFAFISNGEIIVNGTGTIQIVDIMGRVVSTKSTEERISTNGMTPGVYVLRLIGNDTKTQKIVVK